MGFFKKIEQVQKEYCLIGLNRFNLAIGKELIKEGHKTTILDIDPKKIDNLGDNFTYSIVCDATNINELSDIGIQHFDYVVLGITDMKISVIIAAHLRELKVSKVLCKAKDDHHKKILQLLGIPIAYIPEQEISSKVAYRVMYDLNVELFSPNSEMNLNDVIVVDVPIENEYIWNQKIININFIKNISITIISIQRKDGSILVPISGEDMFKAGDTASIICKKSQISEIRNYFIKNIY